MRKVTVIGDLRHFLRRGFSQYDLFADDRDGELIDGKEVVRAEVKRLPNLNSAGKMTAPMQCCFGERRRERDRRRIRRRCREPAPLLHLAPGEIHGSGPLAGCHPIGRPTLPVRLNRGGPKWRILVVWPAGSAVDRMAMPEAVVPVMPRPATPVQITAPAEIVTLLTGNAHGRTCRAFRAVIVVVRRSAVAAAHSSSTGTAIRALASRFRSQTTDPAHAAAQLTTAQGIQAGSSISRRLHFHS